MKAEQASTTNTNHATAQEQPHMVPPREVSRAAMKLIAEESLELFRNIIAEYHQVYPHLLCMVYKADVGMVHVDARSITDPDSPLSKMPRPIIARVWRETPKLVRALGAMREAKDGSLTPCTDEEWAELLRDTFIISGHVAQGRAVNPKSNDEDAGIRKLMREYRRDDHATWGSSTVAIREQFGEDAIKYVLMFNMIDSAGFVALATYDLDVLNGDDDYVTGIHPPRIIFCDEEGADIGGLFGVDPDRPLARAAKLN